VRFVPDHGDLKPVPDPELSDQLDHLGHLLEGEEALFSIRTGRKTPEARQASQAKAGHLT